LDFKTQFAGFLKHRNENLTVIKPDVTLKDEYERLEKLYEKVLPRISKNIEKEIQA